MKRSGVQRWFAHAAVTPLSVHRAFPPTVRASIEAAIGQAEAGHGGEICFAVEGSLAWHYLRRNAAVRHRAVALFSEMRIWDTEHNNGVLIYLNLADRGVEIIADRGIARRVAPQAWQAICQALKERCAAGAYGPGAIEAVRAVGELLRQHFPLAPGEVRVNEIPDQPLTL
jgi:uncharacterized membrane protein